MRGMRRPVPQGLFLSKAEPIDWFVKHLPPANRKTRFDHMLVRIYGDTGVVHGMVIASDETGKEVGRTVFTDIFVYRDGRWQAVNAQENEGPVTGHRLRCEVSGLRRTSYFDL
jgi:hypothetical protein